MPTVSTKQQSILPLQTHGDEAIPAAAYVRMSTEHQQYSTENQLDRIKEWAARRNMNIVRVFEDAGKSGLSTRNRDGLQKLITDVEGGNASFRCILVYDISRWGRFHDADESGYYEYICKRANIPVHYCAEQFENDGSISSTILKNVKRTMAGEYSRELSVKVFQGACRLIQLGYKQGGTAGYGLRRVLVDQHGKQKSPLAMGEQKSLQTDRVVLALGPDEEVATVRKIYHDFVEFQKTEREIADALNARGIQTDLKRPWTRGTVHQLLTNEKYIGNNVYHRTSFKLKKRHVKNPPDMWIRANGVFPAIIPVEMFARAQEIILARARRFTDEEMLAQLRSVLEKNGLISGILIDEHDNMPSSSAYRHRFGSLLRAYELVGYSPNIDYGYIEVNRYLRKKHPEIVQEVISALSDIDVKVGRNPDNDLLVLDGELVVSLVLSRYLRTQTGASRWLVRLENTYRPDVTIVARMDEQNQGIKDYYLFPDLGRFCTRLRLAEDNAVFFDTYRFATLEYFHSFVERVSVEDFA